MIDTERLLRFPPGQRVRILRFNGAVGTGTVVTHGEVYIHVKVDNTKSYVAHLSLYAPTELEPINDGE
jgi:hypothetical protein